MSTDDYALLESMIDKYGLSTLLDNGAFICRSKADNARNGWRSLPMSRMWDIDGRYLETVALKVHN